MTRNIDTLLIVPGHASFKQEVDVPLPADFQRDEYWALQSFQYGEPPYYIEHIEAALDRADDTTLIVLSGGHTRLESGKRWSEAVTYYEIAKTFSRFPLAHIALEEYARDSFQNVDFSVRLFEEEFGFRPGIVKVVGWIFKQPRFELHAATLGYDIEYIGVNNPTGDALANAEKGEARTLEAFRNDPYGTSGSLLQKRLERDPFHEGNPWEGNL